MVHSALSRRRFLVSSLAVMGAAAVPLIAACSQAPASPTAAPAAPAAPSAPTATTAAAAAPAAGAATPTKAAAPAAAATPTTAPAAVAAPATGGKIELRIHDWLQDPNDTFYGPFWKAFEAAHPTVTIKREWFPRNDMHTKELALAATGQIGDIVRINVAVLTPELVAKEVIQALTPFVQADKAWSDYDQKQFWVGNIANYTIKGQQYGYPVVGHPGQINHYVNVDMATAAGVKLPSADNGFKWTDDEAVAAYKALTKTGADGRVATYGHLPGIGGEGTVAVLRRFGGDFYSEDGTKTLINTPESIAGIQWLADLFNKDKSAMPFDAAADINKLLPGKNVAIAVATSFFAANAPLVIKDAFKWTVVPPPIGPSGKIETQVSSDGISMSKATKHPQEAWEVVKAYASKDHGLNRFLNGLGSPGSRDDIWTAPEFKAKVPLLYSNIYVPVIDPSKNPALKPWNHPANARYNETDTALGNILTDVWLGNKKPADACKEAAAAVQAILDKPVP
jgi:multiple sugar transport system substrate-binding protein